MSVSVYIENWLTTFKFGNIKDTSYDRMESTFNVHVKNSSIGKMKTKDVRTEDIQEFLNEKSIRLSFSSVKKIYELFSPSFKYAFNHEDVLRNPMDCVVMPKQKSMNVKTKKVLMYDDLEIEKFKNACEEVMYLSRKGKYRYAPLILFILNTGLRIGECVALKWSNIDFVNKLVYVEETMSLVRNRGRYEDTTQKVSIPTSPKSESGERVIPLNRIAIEALNEMKRRNDDQKISSAYILCNRKGKSIHIRSVEQTFERICNSSDNQYKGIHALRHTFGSLLIRKGADIKVVSDLLGHSNVTLAYNKYIHIMKEMKAKAIEMIEVTSDLTTGYKWGIDQLTI